MTAGLVLLLLVAHPMWWTNREARRGTERKAAALEREWRGGTAAGDGGTTSADGGAASADGGTAAGAGGSSGGSGTGDGTAGPAGNFALAGHRNTHGEPFRYLPRLRRGDAVEVETRTATYTYDVDRILPRTSPVDSAVVRAVPRSLVRPGYGYDEPGYCITLTTCTPEFTSRYRLVVWGKLVSMRPR